MNMAQPLADLDVVVGLMLLLQDTLCRINGTSSVALCLLDVLDMDEIKICNWHYDIDVK